MARMCSWCDPLARGIDVVETGAHEFLCEATLENLKLRERNEVLVAQLEIMKAVTHLTDSQIEDLTQSLKTIADKLK